MKALICVLLAASVQSIAAADESQEVFSGPQPGEQVQSFAVNGVRGEDSGKAVDLTEKASHGPLLIVYVHERTRPAFALTNTVAKFAETKADKGLTAGIVYLTADATETENWLKTINANLPEKIFLGISPDGKEGPGAWGLNRNVALTVIVANEDKVTANFALRQPSVDVDGPKIFQAIADVTGGGPIPDVAEFAGSRRMAERGRETKRGEKEKEKLDDKLRQLLGPVIARTASEEDVNEAAAKVEEEAATDPAFRERVLQSVTRIIEAGKLPDYGTPKAQEFLAKWSKEFAEPAKDANDEKQDK